MAFCKKCGTQMDDQATVCPNCGASANQTSEVVDNGGFLWGLLGCCVPVAGLILFLIWKDTKPKTAKAAGIGALVCVCISVVYYILMLVLGIGVGLLGG